MVSLLKQLQNIFVNSMNKKNLYVRLTKFLLQKFLYNTSRMYVETSQLIVRAWYISILIKVWYNFHIWIQYLQFYLSQRTYFHKFVYSKEVVHFATKLWDFQLQNLYTHNSVLWERIFRLCMHRIHFKIHIHFHKKTYKVIIFKKTISTRLKK